MDAKKSEIIPRTLCPVCGYDLGFPAWDGEVPSDEICPSCGFQFGYDDAGGDSEQERFIIYRRWREKWIKAGMPWFSRHRSRPLEWDPESQLRRVLS